MANDRDKQTLAWLDAMHSELATMDNMLASWEQGLIDAELLDLNIQRQHIRALINTMMLELGDAIIGLGGDETIRFGGQ